jgi:predicted heme/steroid binding protein
LGGVPTTRTLSINGTLFDLSADRIWNVGTVTSVSASVPNGFAISGSPITSSGTLAITFASGYSLPTDARQAQWDVAYNKRIMTASMPLEIDSNNINIYQSSPTSNGYLSSTDWSTFNSKQSALNGTGFVKANGTSISYDNSTYVPTSRTITINGTTFDLSANRSWTVGDTLTASSPLSITSGVISITQASASVNGFLSSTDWSTFNAKQTALSGTGFVKVNGTTITYDNTAYTPASRLLTINGTSYDLTADRSWTITPGSGMRNVQTFTATSGQTTFTVTGGYTVGLVDVYVNGARLSTSDYTATSGTSVVLVEGVVTNDIVDIVAYTATLSSGINGSGTTNYVPKFTSSNVLGNSLIFDDGTNVGIGNASPTAKLHVTGTILASSTVTASSLIRSGGTSAQILAADGSVITAGTNITISGGVISASGGGGSITGSGTTNYISKWTGSTALGNSKFFDNGTTGAFGNTANGSGYAIEFNNNAGQPRFDVVDNGVYTAQFKSNEGVVTLQNNSNNAFVLGTNAVERLRILGNGNIGIGTTTPTDFLTVRGRVGISLSSSGVNQNNSSFYVNNTANTKGLLMGYNDTADNFYFTSLQHGVMIKPMVFNATVASFSDKIVANSNIYGTTTNIYTEFNSGGLISYGAGSTTKYTQIGYDTTGSYGWIQSLTTGVAYNNLIINGAGGNLGIGTISPVAKVDVVGSDVNRVVLRVANTNVPNGDKEINMFVGGTSAFGISAWQNSGVIESVAGLNSNFVLSNFQVGPIIFANSGRLERMRITSTGNVGIATSTPNYVLHVNGSVAGVGGYVNLSDARLKKDVKPLVNSLKNILSLNGITYNWDKTSSNSINFDDDNHIGLLAQDVEKILPQVVSTAKDNFRTKAIAYSDLVPVLIEAIKELNAKIEAK